MTLQEAMKKTRNEKYSQTHINSQTHMLSHWIIERRPDALKFVERIYFS